MGIRIHKALGYGFRPNAALREQIAGKMNDDAPDAQTVAQIIAAAIKAREKEDVWLSFHSFEFHQKNKFKHVYPRHLWEVVVYAEHPDTSRGCYLIIPPANRHDWYRFDDMLDYMEADPSAGKATVRKFDRPVYPYIGWADPKTGETVKMDSSMIDLKQKRPELIPEIPVPVRVLADRVGIPWLQLRPMIVTWWS